MKEIVTCQFGSYANHVGAHFWNFQDELNAAEFSKYAEIDGGVLFREGKTTAGLSTWTPRAVIFETEAELGALRPTGDLYSADVPETEMGVLAADVWAGATAVTGGSRVPKHSFQAFLESQDGVTESKTGAVEWNLDTTVRHWSDYLKVQLHHKTVFPVRPDMDDFDVYAYGLGVLADVEEWESCEDRFRFFLEDCDSIQAIHCLVDCDSGFLGMSSRYLDYLREECPHTPIITMACHRAAPPDDDVRLASTVGVRSHITESSRATRGLNLGYAWTTIASKSSVFMPLSIQGLASNPSYGQLPLMRLNPYLAYQSSSVVAAAIDSMTSSYRLLAAGGTTSSSRTLGSNTNGGAFVSILAPRPSLNIAAVSTALPCPANGESAGDIKAAFQATKQLHQSDPKLVAQLSWPVLPSATSGAGAGAAGGATAVPHDAVYGQFVITRGLGNAAVASTAFEESLGGGRIPWHAHIQTPLPIPITFPRFFEPVLTARGALTPTASESLRALWRVPTSSDDPVAFPNTLATTTFVTTSSGTCSALRFVASEFGAAAANATTVAALAEFGIDVIDLKEAKDNLETLHDSYMDVSE